ncbi:DUF2344 domain-containing protein [bacterium]|nr:DUF2344 domain-containing protein [bacterium]
MQNRKFPYMLRFARDGFACYIGHLDWIRLVLVALDYTHLPIVYTEGYSPKAKLKFSPPLPVGLNSDTELVLIYLRENLSEDIIHQEFDYALPDGMTLLNVKYLYPQPPKNPFKSINGALYEIHFPMELNPDERKNILDTLQGVGLSDDAPEIILKQQDWILKILNGDEFADKAVRVPGQHDYIDHVDYVARLESGRTFHPVKFALALKDYLNLPHLPQGKRLSFLHIEDEGARKLFEF